MFNKKNYRSMKKLVLVVAMFMFVCGSSFFAMAQDSVKPVQYVTEMPQVQDTVVTDTAKQEAPAAVTPIAQVPDSTATPAA